MENNLTLNVEKIQFKQSQVSFYGHIWSENGTTLHTDASKKGLGACLIQNGKVVCYASRALTKTEQNYQNLE